MTVALKAAGNFSEAASVLRLVGKELEPEIAMSLNRAITGVRTDTSRALAKRMGVTRKEIDDWKMHRARPGDMEALAVFSGQRIGLERFAPSPNAFVGGKTTGGVTVKILGKRLRFRHAFMGLKSTNPVRVLQRATHRNAKSKNKDPRYRLNHLTLASAPALADNDEEAMRLVTENAGGRYLKQFDHVLDRLLENFG